MTDETASTVQFKEALAIIALAVIVLVGALGFSLRKEVTARRASDAVARKEMVRGDELARAVDLLADQVTKLGAVPVVTAPPAAAPAATVSPRRSSRAPAAATPRRTSAPTPRPTVAPRPPAPSSAPQTPVPTPCPLPICLPV